MFLKDILNIYLNVVKHSGIPSGKSFYNILQILVKKTVAYYTFVITVFFFVDLIVDLRSFQVS